MKSPLPAANTYDPKVPHGATENTKTPWIFFIGWSVLLWVQAAFTGLLDDEAYYWVYAQFPAWGYFDHPPMTAWLIRAGTWLFSGELGVRFFMVLCSTGTLWVIHRLQLVKNNKLYYLLVAGLAALQIGGMLAVPDLPLVFFTALFFLQYQKFLEKDSWLRTLLLGITMAAMLYAKYHAVLVILFVVIGAPSLLIKVKSWVAVLVASCLFLPHLWWQYQHQFPSVQYHLFERNADAYQFDFTSGYVLGQVLFMGPIMGWLFLWAAFKYKTQTVFERSLKWCLVGLLLFFGISTIKGRVEANWTAPLLIPMFLLAHAYLHQNPRWNRVLKIGAIATLSIVFVARVYMVLNIDPVSWVKKDEFHRVKERAAAIQKLADGRPVVFLDSYQQAAKHWFYTGDTALSLNTVWFRRNNYNFWPIEQQFQQREVLVIGPTWWKPVDTITSNNQYPYQLTTTRGKFHYYVDSFFQSNMLSWIELSAPPTETLKLSEVVSFDLKKEINEREINKEINHQTNQDNNKEIATGINKEITENKNAAPSHSSTSVSSKDSIHIQHKNLEQPKGPTQRLGVQQKVVIDDRWFPSGSMIVASSSSKPLVPQQENNARPAQTGKDFRMIAAQYLHKREALQLFELKRLKTQKNFLPSERDGIRAQENGIPTKGKVYPQQKENKYADTLLVPHPDQIQKPLFLRYGISTSIPKVYTLNSRTVRMDAVIQK